ncbi:MAG: hypothetical protein ACXW1C_03360 [Gallionella sp.]
MRIHPALLIVIWCVSLIAVQRLAGVALYIAASGVCLASAYFSTHKLIQLLRRTRWILLSLLLIYAYASPGQPLWSVLGSFSPVREGVLDGLDALLKLLTALASLAVLLEKLPRMQLIAGLYSLFAPLQWLGVSRERCALRLALTLQYAEAAMLRRELAWQDLLNELFAPAQPTLAPLQLSFFCMTKVDFVVTVLLVLSVLGLIWI